jgi:hypothetical protein
MRKYIAPFFIFIKVNNALSLSNLLKLFNINQFHIFLILKKIKLNDRIIFEIIVGKSLIFFLAIK